MFVLVPSMLYNHYNFIKTNFKKKQSAETYCKCSLHHDSNVILLTWKLPLCNHNWITDTPSFTSLFCYQVLTNHLPCNFCCFFWPKENKINKRGLYFTIQIFSIRTSVITSQIHRLLALFNINHNSNSYFWDQSKRFPYTNKCQLTIFQVNITKLAENVHILT